MKFFATYPHFYIINNDILIKLERNNLSYTLPENITLEPGHISIYGLSKSDAFGKEQNVILC